MSQLTITLIQSNLFWEDKAANLAMFTQKINSIQQPTELILLPEMFSTGFSMRPQQLAETMDGPTIQWMRQLSQQKRAAIAGSLMMEEDGQYFNRLIWMLPNGQMGHYNKRHLFANGSEHLHYTPGNRRFIASIKGWKINLQICYDLRFPVFARQANPPASTQPPASHQPHLEYDILVYVANWPKPRNHAWKTLLQARAIENQCFTIGVNRVGNDASGMYHSGDSMVVNPMGAPIYHKEDEEDIYTVTLHKNELEEVRTQFPFYKDSDAFMIV